MNAEVNFCENLESKRILVAPLDWGLGHFTRCIPLIRKLYLQKNIIYVAAEGAGAALIQKEFPEIGLVVLPGYKINYPKKGRAFLYKMILQLPKIAATVYSEKKKLKKLQKQYRFDVVISDNRLGLSIPGLRNIYMTHQLSIKTGYALSDWLINTIHYHYINRYDECWVPDTHGMDNLAGELSHPQKPPDIPVNYIGSLSRFSKKKTDKKVKLAIVLSGPEPQRSIFEQLIIKQLERITIKVALVRGLPAGGFTLGALPGNILIYDHLDADAMQELMQSAEWVIARSGYSTIMDLIALDQQAVLVPTPGQTEQEYLAKYLSVKKIFIMKKQESFSLDSLVNELGLFDSSSIK